MKLFRITLIFTFLFAIIFFNWNCSDEQLQNTTSKEETQLDGPGNGVSVFISEYVYVTPGNYYEWRPQTAVFICGDGVCFSPYIVLQSGFTTPASPRTEGSNTITTQYFKAEVGYGWNTNVTPVGYHAGWVNVFKNSTQYYSNLRCFCTSQGTYGTESGNLILPANTYINVDYGVTSLQGDE